MNKITSLMLGSLVVPLYMVVGSYSSPEEEGIHVYKFDEENAAATLLNSLSGISNPSYLQFSAKGNRLYSVAEDDDENAAAYALSFDKTSGQLAILNQQKTRGGAPCFINVDRNSRFVVTANYTGGNISVFPLNESGELLSPSQVISFAGNGPDKNRQATPHLHNVVFSPDQSALFAVDLGTDAIHHFRVNQSTEDQNFLIPGEPAEFKVESGSGPRHLTFHPTGQYAYLINELSGMVTAFSYKEGILKPFQYIPSDTLEAQGSADIRITPDGKYLYSSNRLQADGIAIFSIENTTGRLTRIGYQETGIHPRNFIITPNGKYLLVACRDNDLIQVFSINPETGLLTNTGKDIKVSKPVCIQFTGIN